MLNLDFHAEHLEIYSGLVTKLVLRSIILTDQGQQFVGDLKKQICKKLGKKITTAHRPVPTCCLQWWYGTLISMLINASENKLD